MVKHTQTIRRLLPTNCLSVFDHFVGLARTFVFLLFTSASAFSVTRYFLFQALIVLFILEFSDKSFFSGPCTRKYPQFNQMQLHHNYRKSLWKHVHMNMTRVHNNEDSNEKISGGDTDIDGNIFENLFNI